MTSWRTFNDNSSINTISGERKSERKRRIVSREEVGVESSDDSHANILH
jgi:hypothetical protein